MIRFERAESPRFPLWTFGLVTGITLYLISVLSLYFLGRETGLSLTPCLLWQMTGLRCPLCGGTTTGVALMHGDFRTALETNPLVAVALPLIAVALILRFGFGQKIAHQIPKAVFVCGIMALVSINWAYVVFHDKRDPGRAPVGRALLEQLMQQDRLQPARQGNRPF